MQQIMSCCQVLVLPSLIEGLPGVILESFINKLPVVAYNVGGIKEIVIDKQTGGLVDENNETAFLQAIKESLFVPTQTIKENAYSLVSYNYTNKSIAKRFFEFYQKVLNIEN